MSSANLEELKNQAWQAIDEGDFEKARPLIDQVLDMAPDDIGVHALDERWYDHNEDMDDMACISEKPPYCFTLQKEPVVLVI